MSRKNRPASRKTAKKVLKKPKKLVKQEKPTVRAVKLVKPREVTLQPPARVELQANKAESVREGTGFKIVVNRIEGETIIGDLMVVFPRTREILKKHGLNMDVEDAGDIYMSLEAFAALQGLEMEALLLELEVASKEPPPQPPMAAIVAAPAP